MDSAQAAIIIIAVIAGIVQGGRLLVRPLLRWIARSNTPEIFTAAALLLVVGIAGLMQFVGLSMALGAFLAGVLLAESEYRRELETDLEPFKGLLLGLFFIAVGMSIDFAVVLANPGVVAAVVAGFLLAKALVLAAMARLVPIPPADQPVFGILLAQGISVLPPDGVSLKERMAQIERAFIEQALDRADGNVSKTARMLNLQRTTLIEKIDKYRLRSA